MDYGRFTFLTQQLNHFIELNELNSHSNYKCKCYLVSMVICISVNETDKCLKFQVSGECSSQINDNYNNYYVFLGPLNNKWVPFLPFTKRIFAYAFLLCFQSID